MKQTAFRVEVSAEETTARLYFLFNERNDGDVV
jgi:hypothetical protein